MGETRRSSADRAQDGCRSPLFCSMLEDYALERELVAVSEDFSVLGCELVVGFENGRCNRVVHKARSGRCRRRPFPRQDRGQ